MSAAELKVRLRSAVRQTGQCSGDHRDGRPNPTPCVRRDSTTIAPRPTGGAKLVSNDLPVFHLTMATPQRYQTLVERSITPSGMGTETHFVVDSLTNERVAKCRNQKDAGTVAKGLNAAAKNN